MKGLSKNVQESAGFEGEWILESLGGNGSVSEVARPETSLQVLS